MSAVVAAPALASAAHHPGQHVEPVRPGSSYLALGDSVSFGYREPANLPTPDYSNAAKFVGFTEDVGAALKLRVANAASQLQYAEVFLARHRDTRLVTLMIGANGGFLCQATTKDSCASELPGVLARVAANVSTTLRTVRQHYRGQIVIVNYYSTDYRSATQNASSQALNTAMDSAAKPYGVTVADGYGTFQRAAAQAGGDTCAAGLLTTLSTGGCGVHPSVGGQSLLALAVEKAIRR